MQRTIHIYTPARNGLCYDITRQVDTIVAESGVKSGRVNADQYISLDTGHSLEHRVT